MEGQGTADVLPVEWFGKLIHFRPGAAPAAEYERIVGDSVAPCINDVFFLTVI